MRTTHLGWEVAWYKLLSSQLPLWVECHAMWLHSRIWHRHGVSNHSSPLPFSANHRRWCISTMHRTRGDSWNGPRRSQFGTRRDTRAYPRPWSYCDLRQAKTIYLPAPSALPPNQDVSLSWHISLHVLIRGYTTISSSSGILPSVKPLRSITFIKLAFNHPSPFTYTPLLVHPLFGITAHSLQFHLEKLELVPASSQLNDQQREGAFPISCIYPRIISVSQTTLPLQGSFHLKPQCGGFTILSLI